MNILFLTPMEEDYLSDSILHGLKSLSGISVTDYPKRDILYNSYAADWQGKLYGRGFSVYGLLPDFPVDRNRILDKLKEKHFDLVIFGSIGRLFGWFYQLLPVLRNQPTIVLDGEDAPEVYPASGKWWRESIYWFAPRAHNRFLYFKREWTPKSRFSIFCRLLPTVVLSHLPSARRLRRIGFSIPKEKIVREFPKKVKDFPRHVVDTEVRKNIPQAVSDYAFATEIDYYKDLQQSRFGITTKRAGWDCMRHYEIAANGAVICFKDLDKKPTSCAPHGLNPSNSISYSSWKDLCGRIERLSEVDYRSIQERTYRWVTENTTESAARRLLEDAFSLSTPGA